MLWERLWSILAAVTTLQQSGNLNLDNASNLTELAFEMLTKDNSIIEASVGSADKCPAATKYGNGPSTGCTMPSDPNNLPKSQLEDWFTKEMFEDLFPFANLGWGPSPCLPYSYEAFVIAARYFPNFGTSSPNKIYTAKENARRDLSAFFAHAVQETGENNAGLYDGTRSDEDAANCFYRGGFYNWFEGGPTSLFLDPNNPGHNTKDGAKCTSPGRYCAQSAELNYWYPCGTNASTGSDPKLYTSCYFGRGAIQISYNYNYGQFGDWLKTKNISVDLLAEPNLIMTKMNPPLAMMASLWFYMTPQPPKPAMHDIVMGDWNAGAVNIAAGYTGPIFGPTSLIINNECNGEDAENPGGPGESRRIKAFKWFTSYFDVPAGADKLLSCKDMQRVALEMCSALEFCSNVGLCYLDALGKYVCVCPPGSTNATCSTVTLTTRPPEVISGNPWFLYALIALLSLALAALCLYNLVSGVWTFEGLWNAITDLCARWFAAMSRFCGLREAAQVLPEDEREKKSFSRTKNPSKV